MKSFVVWSHPSQNARLHYLLTKHLLTIFVIRSAVVVWQCLCSRNACFIVMTQKTQGSKIGNLCMSRRNHKLLPLSEKMKSLDVRKENQFYVDAARIDNTMKLFNLCCFCCGALYWT